MGCGKKGAQLLRAKKCLQKSSWFGEKKHGVKQLYNYVGNPYSEKLQFWEHRWI